MGVSGHFLSSHQRGDLLARHRRERNARYADRIKTVLLLDDGRSYEEIARILFLDDETARRYAKTFIESGIDVLLSDKYKPYEGKLDCTQCHQLRAYVATHLFLDVLPVILYVTEQFGQVFTRSGMRDILHRLGFVYKKAARVPGKADPEKQRRFVAMLEELMRVKDAATPVLFMDAVHPAHNSMPSHGWILRGERVEIPANTGREHMNINGAVNAETLEVFAVEAETINAAAAVSLLQKVDAWYPDAEHIYVFADNARYYRSREVSAYIAHSRIRLEFLPPYSPNLNIIERLWRFMHKHTTYSRFYPTFQEFREELLMFFQRLPDEFADSLRSLLTLRFNILSGDRPKMQAIA